MFGALALLVVSPAFGADARLLGPDANLRDRLQRARDHGQVGAPMSMWPVTGAVARAAQIDPARCTPSLAISLHAGTGERLALGFGDGAPVDRRASAAVCAEPSPSIAATLRVNVDRARDEQVVHLDGSSLGLVWRGALISAGAVDRFWGPGWSGSLILGDNARPIPAISLRRADATRGFETPWLSWIGPWDAEALFGQLQGHTEPRAPRFFGMRVEAAPASWLTLALSRTMQWGGEGRDNSLRSFWNGFLGHDNVGDSGISVTNEPGNQLGGFDIRVSLAPIGAPVALYTQWIGEDEAGYWPSKYIALSGVETWFDTGRLRWRAVLEHADTVVGTQDQYPGTAYRHHVFRQGYTQHGRIIGFGLGADIHAAIFQLHAFGDGPWSGSLHLLAGTANPGGIASQPYATDSDLRATEVRARYCATGRVTIEAWVGRSRFTRWGATEASETVAGLIAELRMP